MSYITEGTIWPEIVVSEEVEALIVLFFSLADLVCSLASSTELAATSAGARRVSPLVCPAGRCISRRRGVSREVLN